MIGAAHLLIFFLLVGVHLRSDSHSEHFDRSLMYYASGAYTEALNEINRSIEQAPNDSTYHHARANIYYELRRYDDATVDYTEALALNPDDTSIYGRRAWCFTHLGDTVRAHSDWNKYNTPIKQSLH